LTSHTLGKVVLIISPFLISYMYLGMLIVHCIFCT